MYVCMAVVWATMLAKQFHTNIDSWPISFDSIVISILVAVIVVWTNPVVLRVGDVCGGNGAAGAVPAQGRPLPSSTPTPHRKPQLLKHDEQSCSFNTNCFDINLHWSYSKCPKQSAKHLSVASRHQISGIETSDQRQWGIRSVAFKHQISGIELITYYG